MSFSDEISKHIEDIKRGNERTVRGAAVAAFGMIIKETPVLSGRLRSNWFCSGIEGSGRVTDSVMSQSEKVSEVTGNIVSQLDWGTFILTNNLPYAERIEYEGWSDQAPIGVVRVSLARVASNMARKHGQI